MSDGDPEKPPEESDAAENPAPENAAPDEPVVEAAAAEPVSEIVEEPPVIVEPEPAIEAPVEWRAEEPEPPAPEIHAEEAPSQIEEDVEEAVEEPPLMEFPEPPLTLREPARNESLFGEPEIPMPDETEAPAPAHARDAQRVLDLDLGRIKRTKRFGLFGTIFTVLFIALVLAPVTWVGAYRFIDAPGTVLMLQRAAGGQQIRYNPVPITRMSPNIVRAVIAAEDSRFCTHHGFDVEAIEDAMEANADGGRMRGGSTISQQTAKNLFLWPSRSWIRKGFETYFTSLTEFMWPKRRIMEQYLNVAEWGDGIFGVEAASMARFGVHASDLNALQAARLAAVLPSPNRWRADSPGPYVRRRAGTIVQRAQVVQNEGGAACVLALDAPH